MEPAHTIDAVLRRIENSLHFDSKGYRIGSHEASHKAKMIGLLFTRPETELFQKEILSQLDYYHCRSSTNINFYFAGFGEYLQPSRYVKDVAHHSDDGLRWRFDIRAFDEFRKGIEHMTQGNWKYSGESDLILTTARIDSTSKVACFDFGCSIVINLKKAIEDKAILSVATFFERVFHFAELENGLNSVWKLSDSEGSKLLSLLAQDAMFSLLPSPLRNKAQASMHFYVRDLSAKRK